MRTKIFYLSLAVWTILVGVLSLPTLLTFRPKIISKVGVCWAYISLLLLRLICNISYKIQGKSNIPKEKSFLVASKHSSMWETIFLLYYFAPVSFVIKKELLRVPIYGWYLPFMGMIPISRKDGLKAIKHVIKYSKERIEQGFNFIIFPEGSRSSSHAKVKPGIYSVHKNSPNAVVVPISHNAVEHFGASRKHIMKPGTIIVKIGKPIAFNEEYNSNKNKYLKEIEKGINY